MNVSIGWGLVLRYFAVGTMLWGAFQILDCSAHRFAAFWRCGMCVDGWIGVSLVRADGCGFRCGVIDSAVCVGGGEMEGRGGGVYKRQREGGIGRYHKVDFHYLIVHLSI